MEFACLFGVTGLFEEACEFDGFLLLLEFGLFVLILESSLLIGAPTSSGVFLIRGLFKFFLGKLLLLSNLFDGCVIWFKELFFLLGLMSFLEFVKFLGFSISWKDGFGEVLMGDVDLLLEVFLLWSIFFYYCRWCPWFVYDVGVMLGCFEDDFVMIRG